MSRVKWAENLICLQHRAASANQRSFKTNQRETQHESETLHGGFLLAEMLGAHECTLEGPGNEAPCYSYQGQEMSMEHGNFRKNPVRVVGHSEPPNPGATGGFMIAIFVI